MSILVELNLTFNFKFNCEVRNAALGEPLKRGLITKIKINNDYINIISTIFVAGILKNLVVIGGLSSTTKDRSKRFLDLGRRIFAPYAF